MSGMTSPIAGEGSVSAYDDRPLKNALIATGIATLATLYVIISHSWAFFPDPSTSATVLRSLELGFSTVAWVLLLVGPISILFAFRAGDDFVLNYLPYAALAWPASILVIQLSLRAQTGAWYFGYLVDTPVFLITDVLAPALYVYLWKQLEAWRAEADAA